MLIFYAIMKEIISRNFQVDILRGVAILLALFLHFHLSYHLDQSFLATVFSPNFIKAFCGNGNYGVTIFFVVSGFLITSMTLSRYGTFDKVNPFSFYSFRFARIFPCLLLLLGIIVIFNFLPIPIFKNHLNGPSFSLSIFSVITFWHNLLMEKAGYFNYCLNILWSLSVEEVFYIAFPLVCILLRKTRFIVPFLLVVICVGPIFRSNHSQNEIIALYGYFSCFDGIAMGCLAAIVAQKIQFTGLVRKLVLWSSIITMVVVYFYNGIMENVVWGISFMAIATAFLLITAENAQFNFHSLPNRLLAWFGKHSYELYLFHIIILALMKEICTPAQLGDFTKLLWMALFFALSMTVAAVIAKYFSEPANLALRSIKNSKEVLAKLVRV